MLRLSSPPRRGLLPVNTSSAQVAGQPAGHATSPRRPSTATWPRRRPGHNGRRKVPDRTGWGPADLRCLYHRLLRPARGRRRQTGTPRSCALSVPSSSTSPAVGASLPNGTRAGDLLHPRFGRADRLPTAVRYWSCTAATSRPGALTFTPLASAQARTAFGSTPARIVPARAGPGRRRRRVGAAGRSGPRRRTRRAVLRRAGT